MLSRLPVFLMITELQLTQFHNKPEGANFNKIKKILKNNAYLIVLLHTLIELSGYSKKFFCFFSMTITI